MGLCQLNDFRKILYHKSEGGEPSRITQYVNIEEKQAGIYRIRLSEVYREQTLTASAINYSATLQ